MTYYFIRVYDDHGDSFREYDITTDKGEDMARLYAFLMDGGCGQEFEDDMVELAKMHTDVIERSAV